MSHHYTSPIREPLIEGNKTYHDITDDIAKATEGSIKPMWLVALLVCPPSVYGVFLTLSIPFGMV